VKDYYEILGATPDADASELKRCYHEQVKRFHPDRNQSRKAWAERKVRQVIEAYSVLSAIHRYRGVRRRVQRVPDRDQQRWSRLRKYHSEAHVRCRMILHYLLNGRAQYATQVYEILRRDEGQTCLWFNMKLRDYMDCAFLLAEEYERQKRYSEALDLYAELYRRDEVRDAFRYFTDEVRERARNMTFRILARLAEPEEAINYYQRILEFDLMAGDRALAYKKMAECYCDLGLATEARDALEKAFNIRPNLKGAQKICKRLEMDQNESGDTASEEEESEVESGKEA